MPSKLFIEERMESWRKRCLEAERLQRLYFDNAQSLAHFIKMNCKTLSSTKGRYDLHKTKDGKWYFTRVAGNGAVEMYSKRYSRRHNAVQAISRVTNDTRHYKVADAKT
ncbi:MAG: DUF1508 domain-containing protein [Planctomycetota bacterium]